MVAVDSELDYLVGNNALVVYWKMKRDARYPVQIGQASVHRGEGLDSVIYHAMLVQYVWPDIEQPRAVFPHAGCADGAYLQGHSEVLRQSVLHRDPHHALISICYDVPH